MAFDPLLYLSALLIAAILTLVLVVRRYNDKVSDLREEVQRLSSSRQSLATTYGRITEQWAPFMADYPYDPRNFRFLGSPIDGVQFEENKVVFVEFKTNSSRLTPTQERIRALVEQGEVEWLEFRLAQTDASASRPGFTGTGAHRE